VKEAWARKDLDTVREVGPALLEALPADDFAGRVDVANILLEAGQYRQAEATYRDVVQNYPAFTEVRYDLGLALAKQKRFVEAASAMASAIEAGYENAKVCNNLGLAYKNAGQADAAAKAFRRALEIDPGHWHAAYNLGRLLLATGDRAGALAALRLAREHATAAGASTEEIDAVMAKASVEPEP
jgi:Flp pilus assembly protein TadD